MPARPSASTLALVAAAACGALLAVQTRLNAALAHHLGDALLAALVSFLTGLVVIVAAVAVRRSARRACHQVKGISWWARLGGLGGATLVAVSAFAAPRIGVAALTVGLVAGQTTGGLLVDRAGLGPGGPRPLTGPRVAGALLCLLAVVVSVTGRGLGAASPGLLALVLGAGLLSAVQQALNGRLRRHTGDAAVTTLVNFLVGSTALLVVYLCAGAVAGWPIRHWPGAGQWWLYSGGPLGAVFVAVAAVIVRTLGVLRLGLGIVAGQLLGAIALDLAVPAAGQGLAVATALGAALTLVAVGITGRPSRAGAVPV